MRHIYFDSDLGRVRAAWRGAALRELVFVDMDAATPPIPSSHTSFADTDSEIAALIADPVRGAGDLVLDPQGTAFQQAVWAALRTIPPGTRETYAALAARLGHPNAVRAVANACGANPVAVAIPCHRVVRADGSLGGYRWGIARKQALLEREAAAARAARIVAGETISPSPSGTVVKR